MHRSSSSSVVTEQPLQSHNLNDANDQLPTYDPRSNVAKKERSLLRFTENAVHAIPLVIVLCAIVLWFFSKSDSRI